MQVNPLQHGPLFVQSELIERQHLPALLLQNHPVQLLSQVNPLQHKEELLQLPPAVAQVFSHLPLLQVPAIQGLPLVQQSCPVKPHCSHLPLLQTEYVELQGLLFGFGRGQHC